MSAFANQSSYNPDWRNQAVPQGTPQSIAPAVTQPNFAPSVTQAWADPARQQVGTFSGAGEYNLYRNDPWKNPLDQIFRPFDPNPVAFSANSPHQAQGINRTQIGNVGYGADASGRQLGPVAGHTLGLPRSTFSGPGLGFSSTKDLYNRVQGMSQDQLLKMSNYSGALPKIFGNIAQDYTNAFANPDYGSPQRINGQPYVNGVPSAGASPFGKNETMDWLQKSYDDLYKKMNDNYLL